MINSNEEVWYYLPCNIFYPVATCLLRIKYPTTKTRMYKRGVCDVIFTLSIKSENVRTGFESLHKLNRIPNSVC